MAKVLLVGSDPALLEGIVQSLDGLGHAAVVASSFAEAVDLAAADPPIVAVAERRLALDSPEVLRLPVAAGGALILYHLSGQDPIGLPLSLQRLILADLALPLERHRLAALIHSVEERARTVGRLQRRSARRRLEKNG